jgi:hypothetical protein
MAADITRAAKIFNVARLDVAQREVAAIGVKPDLRYVLASNARYMEWDIPLLNHAGRFSSQSSAEACKDGVRSHQIPHPKPLTRRKIAVTL